MTSNLCTWIQQHLLKRVSGLKGDEHRIRARPWTVIAQKSLGILILLIGTLLYVPAGLTKARRRECVFRHSSAVCVVILYWVPRQHVCIAYSPRWFYCRASTTQMIFWMPTSARSLQFASLWTGLLKITTPQWALQPFIDHHASPCPVFWHRSLNASWPDATA